MSSFWNPFKTDKHYFVRTFNELYDQHMTMWVGDDTPGEETLGLLDYVVFPSLIARWVAKNRVAPPNRLLHIIIESFFIFKVILLVPLGIPILSFLYLAIYHQIVLWIVGRPLKKCLDNLEILPYRIPTQLYVVYLDPKPELITYNTVDTVVTKLSKKEQFYIVLFADTTMFYLDRSSKMLQMIEPSATNDFNQQFRELREKFAKEGPFYVRAPSAAHNKFIEFLTIPIEFSSFLNHYYEKYPESRLRLGYVEKPDLKETHAIRVSVLEFYYLDSDRKHLFIHVPGWGLIIPSQENKAFLKPLLDRSLFKFEPTGSGTFIDLVWALEKPDPFRQNRQLITGTPKFLLEVLGRATKDLYPIITDYLGYKYTKEEKKVVAESLGVKPEDAKPAASYKVGP